ncbi:hypothetical protein ACFY7C_19195 [Streptomyces sp. NPDC012769]|uniref:hypothetical protein n=1 Tax=Streptomyces sp. NPDC012769 TaxID=3364848 RepID=UPI0036B2EBE8
MYRWFHVAMALLMFGLGVSEAVVGLWGWAAFSWSLAVLNAWFADREAKRERAEAVRQVMDLPLPPYEPKGDERLITLSKGYEPVETPLDDEEAAWQAHTQTCRICQERNL